MLSARHSVVMGRLRYACRAGKETRRRDDATLASRSSSLQIRFSYGTLCAAERSSHDGTRGGSRARARTKPNGQRRRQPDCTAQRRQRRRRHDGRRCAQRVVPRTAAFAQQQRQRRRGRRRVGQQRPLPPTAALQRYSRLVPPRRSMANRHPLLTRTPPSPLQHQTRFSTRSCPLSFSSS